MPRRFLGLTACRWVFGACAALAHGQTSNIARSIILNVSAVDAKGNPVTNLTAADFQIFDQGKLQPMASFKGPATPAASASEMTPPTTLIIFDLLNSVPAQREYITTALTRALEPLDSADSVYLYLLTNHGELFPVRGLVRGPDAKLEGEHWNRFARGLLDSAIQKVFGFRPIDDKDQGVRSATTFQVLNELAEQMKSRPGPKTIVWVTSGVLNWVHPYVCRNVVVPEGGGTTYVAGKCRADCMKWSDGKCLDYTPFLQHFSRTLDQATTILESAEYTPQGALPPAEPGSAHDTLQQLSDLTGGRMYSAGDVDKAIAQALRDAPTRYRISYEAPSADGKYHKVRVVCSRKGIRVESKRGYYAYADQMRQ